MGTPLPPNEPGELCSVCWGPSDPFGPGPTPRTVEMQLHDMQPGDNFTTDLEQLLLAPHFLIQTVTPCLWEVADSTFLWQWFFSPIATQCLVLSDIPPRNFFFGNVAAPCLLQLPNLTTDPADQVMFGGFATLTWNLDGL